MSLQQKFEVMDGPLLQLRVTALFHLASEVKVTQLCPTFCDPTDYTVHGILQARILQCYEKAGIEDVAVLFRVNKEFLM